MTNKILFLPIAREDIELIVLYISDCLYAPKAALDFLYKIEQVIDSLKTFPFTYPVYETTKPLDFEYRMIPVKNYLIFYVVTEDIVEIHRVIYSKMDLTRLIK